MDNIENIFKDTYSQLFGSAGLPEWCNVIFENRTIPFLKIKNAGDNVEILLDDRMVYIIPKNYAYSVIGLASNCLAIGQGYSWCGAERKEQPFAPKILSIEIKNN